MKRLAFFIPVLLALITSQAFLPAPASVQPEKSPHDLVLDTLPSRWDEALPLGNGQLGALVWRKGDKLRLSLDRADLWDLRPMENLRTPEWRFRWVREQWEKDTYASVQERFDRPYDEAPAPTKIPAAALEFDIAGLGRVLSARLNIREGIAEMRWAGGIRLMIFVHATEPVGWYRWEGLDRSPAPVLVAPPYADENPAEATNPVDGQDLRRLGYPAGKIDQAPGRINYLQEGWGGFRYEVHLREQRQGRATEGCWSISSSFPSWPASGMATAVVGQALKSGLPAAWKSHRNWWRNFWSQSSLRIPDSLLEKQWYLEQYKFGAAARKGAPPISRQSVWTADNGRIPPWKGDFHHDLNTQLSYWPAYSGNHLAEEEGFLDWLWSHRETFRRYTRDYFETEGLNVPGVTTLEGEPMGGWIQYSFGPTVSAWLAHHFYLHWRYTMDRGFLEERAYPWLHEVALFLDGITVRDTRGMRKLPLSSSPEIYANSRKAWFSETTNYDLALIRWTYEKAAELAGELGRNEEAAQWRSRLDEWPTPTVDEQDGLVFAPGVPYHDSHRHFSHLMAFHPLGLIDWSKGKADREIIRNTLTNLDRRGSDWWTGYSFSWLGNLRARAFDGEGAASALRLFAECFCLSNSFHVNGDQCLKGHSRFTYRPFTLEGNFAFAAGIQEMLLQSHTGVIRIFPAVPASWKNIEFDKLRSEGAFLVSARQKEGKVTKVIITAEKDGKLQLHNPFGSTSVKSNVPFIEKEGLLLVALKAGQKLILEEK